MVVEVLQKNIQPCTQEENQMMVKSRQTNNQSCSQSQVFQKIIYHDLFLMFLCDVCVGFRLVTFLQAKSGKHDKRSTTRVLLLNSTFKNDLWLLLVETGNF